MGVPSAIGSADHPLGPMRTHRDQRWRIAAAGTGVLVGLVLFLLTLTETASVFEWRTLDMRFAHRPPAPVKSDLAIIFIGDDSIQGLGRWPWPWETHAMLVDILKRHGARAVLFDVIFAEKPRDAGEGFFPETIEAAGNVFLSSYFEDLERNPLPGWPPVGSDLVEPVGSLQRVAKGTGHINDEPDDDGVTRRIPLIVRYNGRNYPSTALLAALDRLGASLEDVTIEPGVSLNVRLPGSETLRIPVGPQGQTLVNFTGGLDSFEQYSYLQVLQADQFPDGATIDLERFRGKTVLVGVTFAGNTDVRATPISKAYPLICVLGNAVDNIVQRDFVRRASFPSRLVTAILLGATTGLLFLTLRPLLASTAAVISAAGVITVAVRRFESAGVWVDVVAPLSIIVVNYLIMTTALYVWNRRENKRSLEHLKYMNDLVETTNEGIVSFSPSGGIATWNRGAEKIFGWTAAQAAGKTSDSLVTPADREALSDAARQVLADRQPRSLELSGVRADGTVFPASMSLSAVTNSRGLPVGASLICMDLTEKKRMMETLIQSEKLAEIGRLGSGIVHEIKNPLTSIIMLSESALETGPLDEKSRKYFTIIDQEAQRILNLTRNVLSFARPKKAEMKPVELNRVLTETLALLQYELKKGKLNLKTTLREGGVTVVGDEEKLKQVFLNLIINSAHAMTDGGDLEIATDIVERLPEVDEGFHSLSFGTPLTGRCALATVRDHGAGIEKEIMEKIFEPFFTTKAEGKGTGLGLYITRSIIAEHQGGLMVSSLPGRGVVFRITLPLAR